MKRQQIRNYYNKRNWKSAILTLSIVIKRNGFNLPKDLLRLISEYLKDQMEFINILTYKPGRSRQYTLLDSIHYDKQVELTVGSIALAETRPGGKYSFRVRFGLRDIPSNFRDWILRMEKIAKLNIGRSIKSCIYEKNGEMLTLYTSFGGRCCDRNNHSLYREFIFETKFNKLEPVGILNLVDSHENIFDISPYEDSKIAIKNIRVTDIFTKPVPRLCIQFTLI